MAKKESANFKIIGTVIYGSLVKPDKFNADKYRIVIGLTDEEFEQFKAMFKDYPTLSKYVNKHYKKLETPGGQELWLITMGTKEKLTVTNILGGEYTGIILGTRALVVGAMVETAYASPGTYLNSIVIVNDENALKPTATLSENDYGYDEYAAAYEAAVAAVGQDESDNDTEESGSDSDDDLPF